MHRIHNLSHAQFVAVIHRNSQNFIQTTILSLYRMFKKDAAILKGVIAQIILYKKVYNKQCPQTLRYRSTAY